MNGTIASPASGSAYHHPHQALRPRPPATPPRSSCR